MALVTLNSSIDVPDNLLYHHLSKSSIASVNEMESIAEFVAECVVDSEFEFDEQRNDDNNNSQLAKKITPAKFKQDIPDFTLINRIAKQSPILFSNCISWDSDFVYEITPPPPKV